MRFVYVIAHLKRALKAKDKVLDDLDNMAIKILNGVEPFSDSDKAMVALIDSVVSVVCAEHRALASSLRGYEYRRDFRPAVTEVL